MTGSSLPGHYLLFFLWTMQSKIHNTGKTPAKNKYGKILHIKSTLCPIFTDCSECGVNFVLVYFNSFVLFKKKTKKNLSHLEAP